MENIKKVINILNNYNYDFCNKKFKLHISNVVKTLYPKLNNDDLKILQILTIYLIEDISIKFFDYDSDTKQKYYSQWTQNSNRDILSISLQLIPFMDNKNDNYLFKNIIDLNQILYKELIEKIPSDIDEIEIKKILNDKFTFGNFSLGLLNNEKENSYLDMYNENNEKLIYEIIHNNFCALLETIKIINGKLYVNWINISPLNFDNAYKSKIYNISKKEYESFLNINSEIELQNNMINNNGIYIGDYYNILRNVYYESIKKDKWVLFNTKTQLHPKGIYMIQYLFKILDLSQIFNYMTFDNLTEYEQNKFSNTYYICINCLVNKKSIYDDHNFEINIFKSLISFLVNNSKDKNLLSGENINKFKTEDDDDDETNDIDKIEKSISDLNLTENIIIEAMKEIEPTYIWNYIKQVIDNLTISIYGTFLIKNNNIDLTYFNFKLNNIEEKINLKNIYNICKILSHSGDRKFNLLSTSFKSLGKENQIKFFKSFKKPYINFRKNLQLQENSLNISGIKEDILASWINIRENLIWQYLLSNGLLSEFKLQLDLTDENFLPKNANIRSKKVQERLKKKFKQNPNLMKSYYYLTNNLYSNIKDIRIKDSKEKSYEEALTSELSFYTFYAMDWISQINFFNHYINHQILYVTGSTGTGKSTQVPKLLLYALKAISYRLNGRVICTQPRISPTEGNATWISQETGVPIEFFSKTSPDKINSNNYYLQFKHQKNQHIKDNCNHLTLRMVTDGTLLIDLLGNPVLKEQIKKKKKNINQYEYTLKNKYDVVIIDEAHEHNTNMDIILTLMRQACFYNNSVKLVIVSATMDDDEPIYRSYFNMINDNVEYPIKQKIFHPILSSEVLINSVLLDRRIHISAPGKTTMFKIEDIFNDTIVKFLTGNHKKDAQIAQDFANKQILDICNKSPTGEILLFSTGQREIGLALTYLNENLPADSVALPFYGILNSKYRNVIEKIDISIANIQNFRKNIINEWGEKYIEVNDVPKGTYKRAIIIATNVAEASITIPRLKYVIDTGYAKVMTYDKYSGTSILDVEPISEASRLQRRGRVGRKSSGIVYYMYPKGAREMIKPKYGITLGNFTTNFLQLASNDTDELNNNLEKELWAPGFHPYMVNLFKEYYNAYINNKMSPDLSKEVKQFLQLKLLKKNPNNMINTQYILNSTTLIDEEYFPKPYFNFWLSDDIIPNWLNRKFSGYNFNQLIDLYGSFYIIHPFENTIKRNVLNQIIEYKNTKKDKILLQEWESYLNVFRIKLFYLNIDSRYQTIENESRLEYKKTIFYNKVNELTSSLSKLNFEDKDVIFLLYCSGYNVLNLGLQIITLLSTISYNISSVVAAKDNSKFIEFDKFYKIFSNNKSDIVTIISITNLIYKNLYSLKIFKFFHSNKFLIKYKRIYQKYINEFKKFKFTVDPSTSLIYLKDLNLLSRLKNQGKLDDDKGFLEWLSNSSIFKNELVNDIKNNSNKIKKLCETYFLNYNIIDKYLNNLIDTFFTINTIEKDLDNNYNEQNPFIFFKENFSSNFMRTLKYFTDEEKIIYSFLMSNPLNIGVKYDNKYINMYSNKYKLMPSFFNISNYKLTTCKNISNYILYLNLTSLKGETYINFITNINPNILSVLIPHHYNKNFIKFNYAKKKDNQIIFTKINSDNWTRFVSDVNNNFTKVYFPLKSSELPVINYFLNLI
uniref:RNA helicase n=1 Tax=Megaviridae environmental sample TaxID=1737588 RepID=A0A5J6VK59_9VIRU|nr:MAG: hypothetical protein [Megaviridae environmental sample]